MVSLMKKSVLAGTMIAVASLIYVNCENRVVGAVLFSVGLLVIIHLGFYLYTGRIGFVRNIRQFALTLVIFLFNCIGCFILYPYTSDVAVSIIQSKLSTSIGIIFMNSVICGILIFIAVVCKNNLFTVLCVSGFILCGAEHSIADVCYIVLAKEFTLKSAMFIFVVLIGNAVGSIVFSLMISDNNKNPLQKRRING